MRYWFQFLLASLLSCMCRSFNVVGYGFQDRRAECTEHIGCDSSWTGSSGSFHPSVQVDCYRDPAQIQTKMCIRVRIRTMVDYQLQNSDQYVYIVLQSEHTEGGLLYEQLESHFNMDQPSGIALDGVLVYTGTLNIGEDALSMGGPHGGVEQIDRCGGTLSAESDARYHYRAMPTCVLGVNTQNTEAMRRTYVADVHELLDFFEDYRGRHILGYALDGYPIYSPLTDRGLLQGDLDNCNGKAVNGTYAYYSTPWFPYMVGCFGPGVYPIDQSEGSLGSTDRGAGSACPGGSRYSKRTNGCVPCPAGSYSETAYTLGEACTGKCPIGHWCPEGSQAPIPCPRGRFGSALGEREASCSGPCAAGYWCPEASYKPDSVPCGNASYFCPTGSSFPDNVLPSFYSVPEAATLKVGQQLCEPGYYCLDGVRHSCPAGVYGETAGLMDPNCTSICPIGYYCPQGSQIPIACPAGRYGAVTGLSESACSGACEKGYWCPLASSTPRARECPGGRFGPTEGLKTSHCSSNCEPDSVLTDQGKDQLPAQLHIGNSYLTSEGLSENVLANPMCVYSFCKEGYYCPKASVVATQVECGDPSVYCPTGSEKPTPVSDGHYTLGLSSLKGGMQLAVDSTTRVWQAPCENGFYCMKGVKSRCPAGRYGENPAETDPTCSGLCDGGFFCKEGSAFRNQNPCGSPAVYCPQGSSEPHVVPAGYYSINGTDSTRSAIVKCPSGHYCVRGVKRPCAAGRYSLDGSPSAFCDGLCAPGFYCPPASSSETQMSCPAGRYGEQGMTDSSCLGICARGFFCPQNSTSSRQNECGGEYLYCPVGSALPTEVDIGHYSTGGTPTTRFAQQRCEYESTVLGSPPAAGARVNICPSTTRWLEEL